MAKKNTTRLAIPQAKVTTRPSPSQDSPTTNNPEASPCCYCQRPITKRIRAAKKSYCGKLCAAMGLIADVHEQNGIDDGCGSMRDLLDNVLGFGEPQGGPRAYPVKVRWSDALDFDSPDTRPDFRAEMVVIDDDGTPDWIPARANVVDLGRWKSQRGHQFDSLSHFC